MTALATRALYVTLDQVPTEERTAPLTLSQVPLEMGLGGVSFVCLYNDISP